MQKMKSRTAFGGFKMKRHNLIGMKIKMKKTKRLLVANYRLKWQFKVTAINLLLFRSSSALIIVKDAEAR